MIKNLTSNNINKDKKLLFSFVNAELKETKTRCNIYQGNFYLDSFNYFLINEDFKSFDNLYVRDKNLNFEHFFSKVFFNNFKKKLENFKEFKNIFVLGSNAGNNYYSNLLQFLPRIFFIKEKNIRIAIHRNSSLKLREFIKNVLNEKSIKCSFVYLDDGFYKFKNCSMPQFFSLTQSIKILQKVIKVKNFKSPDTKIYVSRASAYYRKIINEADILPILRSKGYKVINPELYTIDEQIRIFSQADKIISPHGSNLSNIIFCKPGTEILEILPTLNKKSDSLFEDKFRNIARINKLNYHRIISDSVNIDNYSEVAKMYIHKKTLYESNYYKNLIVKVSDIKNLI